MRPRSAEALLVVLALGLAAIVAEGLLRLAGVGYASFYVPDRFRGAAHRPGAEGWYRREGESYVRIGEAGMRDRDHALAKPPGAWRVAFLGDSYTEAMQVDAREAYWAVAERELAGCAALEGRSVEALNFGVSGYGTAQAIETLRHVAARYEPDAVVLGFLTGNDLRNNHRGLEGDPLRPYFAVRDGALVLDDAFLDSPEWKRTQSWWWQAKDRAVANLRLLQVVYEARNAVVRTRLAPAQDESERPIYGPPPDARWEASWDATERMLRLLRDETRAGGAHFELLVLTNWRQVHPDPAVRAREAAALGAEDLRYPDRRLEAFAGREGIAATVLVDAFAEEAERRGVCLHGFENAQPCGGHWNAQGHALAGRLLGRALCERLAASATAR